MEKKFNYVYITTNLINGKQYVGDHSTNNINDNYLGSGRPHFERAKRKYGKENFNKEILEQFKTKLEAFNAQEKWINEYNTLSPEGYNISPKGGHNVKGCWNEESKNKLRKFQIGKIGYWKGKTLSKEHKEKISQGKKNSPHKIKNLSKEHKEKISKSLSGENNPNFGKETWMKGKFHTEKTKNKLRESHIGKKHSEKTKQKISNSQKRKNILIKNLKNL